MQNQILHPAQHTRTPAQVVRRIGTNILESGANSFTSGKEFLKVYLFSNAN
jgi:hypothetical protein